MVNSGECAKNLQGRVFSYNVVNFENKKLESYYFHRVDFVKSIVSNYDFIKCNMSHMDAREAYFENCKFEDCDFRHSNFTNAVFKNCIFTYTDDYNNINIKNYSKFTSKFEKSGMFGTVFKDCKFKNCYIKGLGFRYSLFENCKFESILNYSVSFENATIKKCEFDTFDIRSSAVYGLTIEKSQFKKLICRFEKSIQIIGIDEIYDQFEYSLQKDENSEQEQYLLIFSKTHNFGNKEIDMFETFKSLMKTKKGHFEILNMFFIMDKLKNEQNIELDTIKDRVVQIKNLYTNITDVEKFVLAYMETQINDENTNLSLQDRNMILKLLFYKKSNIIYIYDNLLKYKCNTQTNIAEKSMFNYYQNLYKNIKLEVNIILNKDLCIGNITTMLNELKSNLEKNGIYENYHYKLSYISAGSIEISLSVLAFTSVLLLSSLKIKYSKIIVNNQEKIEYHIEYDGNKTFENFKNFIQDKILLGH